VQIVLPNIEDRIDTMTPDDQLNADVKFELKWEQSLHSADIQVSSKNGVVTLSGTVPHYAEKQVAERATQRVQGVKAIAEELEVNLSGVHHRPDSEIAQSVVDGLKWHVWIPNHVHAVVEKGWVTLTGQVTWGFQRQSAEEAIRFQSGVKGVTNHISLKPTVEASSVKEAIEKALKRNAELDAKNIKVTADGGKITLAGSVSSWDERQEASSAAWNAPGVTGVENDLVVNY
jgi:osmotically-inducible protein OsmY